MTKKPTRAEIEAARLQTKKYLDSAWEGMKSSTKSEMLRRQYKNQLEFLKSINNILAWCAEQEQKGE